MNITTEKIRQACALLDEMALDLWLLYVRETPVMADPALAMVVGDDCTWESFFLYTRKGEAIALVGDLDAAIFDQDDRFTRVLTYTKGVGHDIRTLLTRLNPQRIVIDYSLDNPSADGLTHGMYLKLMSYLEGTAYADRLTSAETFFGKLRSRKSPAEIERLAAAAMIANKVWREMAPEIAVGMTEIQIAALIDGRIREHGAEPSFPTIVNAGDKTRPGHGHPTGAVLEPGDLLHIDFGARLHDYCSDIQRLMFFRRPGESSIPLELTDAFVTVADIITATGKIALPGAQGHEIDTLARQMLRDEGYEEYQHALGHQLGRSVHDGGALLGPKWERYGASPTISLEESNIFTLELEIMLPGIGCVGLEEDVQITGGGAKYLCPRQTELIVR
jgi:Xaa-Pro aminopeptidase